MRLATFRLGSEDRVGVADVENESVHDVTDLLPPGIGVLQLIMDWTRLRPALDPVRSAPAHALDAVTLRAPIPEPRRDLFCVGKNYREHAVEFSRSGYDAAGRSEELPTHPVVFAKATTAVTGPYADIDPHPGVTGEIDYEAELAVIIGRGGRSIPREQAYDHVWGYTIVNDVTARDLQRAHEQWLLGKSLDTFCPMGPFAVSADEIPDVTELRVSATVNGEPRQSGTVRDLVFDIPDLIATISAGVTLLPGDIIATGTPAGVGVGFAPPRFLTTGDLVEVSISGLGTLRNRIGRRPGSDRPPLPPGTPHVARAPVPAPGAARHAPAGQAGDLLHTDLAAELATAEALAREAGRLQLRERATLTVHGWKAHANDLVSDVDLASERLIVDGLRAAHPADGVLAEEGSNSAGASNRRWIVDPLDGTRNYVTGAGPWSVCIALQDGNDTVVAVIHDPGAQETFTAVRGAGATLNGEPLRASECSRLAEAIVGFSFNPSSQAKRAVAEIMPALLLTVGDIRRVPAALHLSYLAAGRFDAGLLIHTKLWDIAAGLLVAAEAGVVLSGPDGTPTPELTLAAAPGLWHEFSAAAATAVPRPL